MAEYIERDSLLKKAKSLQNKLFAVPLILDAIEYAPAVDVVSREVFEQVKWERDTALQTLKEHGIGLGGKADVVEVVRCKECIYHNVPPCPMRLSLNWTNDHDYCSYGKRKEGAEE